MAAHVGRGALKLAGAMSAIAAGGAQTTAAATTAGAGAATAGAAADIDLRLMKANQTLASLTADVLAACSAVFERARQNRWEEARQIQGRINELVEIGMPVEMVTRRLRSDGDERGLLVYGYKFRPVLQTPAV